jgi:hypothetical protein
MSSGIWQIVVANIAVTLIAEERCMHSRNSKVLVHIGLSILFAAGLAQTAPAQQSPREQLKQYIADLQRNPSDDALREKAIKLALTLDPKPAIPDDAAVAAAKGKTIFAHVAETGSKDDLKAAADAFAKASMLAPWVADYYFNQAAALDKAGEFDDAVHSLNFYLLAAPNAPDANDVRGKIEGIKYEKDSAARQAIQQAQAAQERERQLLANLTGMWRRKTSEHEGYYDLWSLSMTPQGSFRMKLTGTHYGDGPQGDFSSHTQEFIGTIAGHQIRGTYLGHVSLPVQFCGKSQWDEEGQWSGSIEEDGRAIAVDFAVQVLKLDNCRWMQDNQHFTFKKEE